MILSYCHPVQTAKALCEVHNKKTRLRSFKLHNIYCDNGAQGINLQYTNANDLRKTILVSQYVPAWSILSGNSASTPFELDVCGGTGSTSVTFEGLFSSFLTRRWNIPSLLVAILNNCLVIKNQKVPPKNKMAELHQSSWCLRRIGTSKIKSSTLE